LNKFRHVFLAYTLRRKILLGLFVICFPIAVHAQTTIGTQSLSVTLNAAAVFTLGGIPSATPLTSSVSFGNYTGSVTVNQRARTTSSSGSGAITIQAGGDFAPVGGPTIANLTYTCSGTSGNGFTPCSGTQTVAISAVSVLGIGAGTCTGVQTGCSNADPNTLTLSFTLPDKPSYKTRVAPGYTTTITWTISGS
jgi:hypothetical protein